MTTVRHHIRSAPGTGEAARQAWEERAQQRYTPPPAAASVASAPGDDSEPWWDEEENPQPELWSPDEEPASGLTPAQRRTEWAFGDLQEEMRQWRSLPEPEAAPAEPMDPAKAHLLGLDNPGDAERFERLRAYRDAGYTGPLDRDNRIPDPDDPENHGWLHAAAAMRANQDG